MPSLTRHDVSRSVTPMPSVRGKQSRVSALEVSAAPEAPQEIAASPLYGVAMLKIAMELKKADAQPVEALITGVLSRMRLDEGEFRRFLEANGGLLKAIAQKRYA